MSELTIKRGPKKRYEFENYPVGTEITLEPLKQSSFKSTLSKFNKSLLIKQQWGYEQIKRNIIATRVK